MGSLKAISNVPSVSSSAVCAQVWLLETAPDVISLVREGLGPEALVEEIQLEELSRRRASSDAGLALVCDTKTCDLERVVTALAQSNAEVPIVALCEDSSAAVARALKVGAYDCVINPAAPGLLGASIERAAAHHRLTTEYRKLQQRAEQAREPLRNLQPSAASPPNGRWLHNVLPLDPQTKTESSSLSVGGSEPTHKFESPQELDEALSPEQHLRHGHGLGEAKADFERRYLQAALTKCRGNLAAAARCSGMDRSNFRRLLKRYGLHHPRANYSS